MKRRKSIIAFCVIIAGNYWPCVSKFANTLELSYMDAQQNVHEEAETLSALAGLSVMSNTAPANCLQWVQIVVRVGAIIRVKLFVKFYESGSQK